jgi:hypothetical protein
MKTLKLAATLLSTLMLAAIGTTSVAATDHNTIVSGFEMYATSNEGRFSGTATGQGLQNGLWGGWSIVVYHTSLGPCFAKPVGEPCANVYDGSFSLLETGPARELVTGQFDNVSQVAPPQKDEITLRNPGYNCTDQVFSITDGLRNVGTGSQHAGKGSFAATLTHHQRNFFGRCITYAATVSGNVVLNF